jgi:hypothetical protein
MKIQWNKVTWYSKLLAVIVFAIVTVGGFYGGMWLGYLIGYVNAPMVNTDLLQKFAVTVHGSDGLAEYYTNPSEWAVDDRKDAGFTVRYPIDFQISDNYSATPATDWRVNGNQTKGIVMFSLVIPKVFEPQTNFDDAKLTIGSSRNSSAIAGCTKPDTNATFRITATTTIDGIPFSVSTTSDAGAGNLYETTSYRTVHNGQCWAIEYTIHSSQIGNYPPSFNLQPVDDVKLKSALDTIVQAVTFP